MKYLMIKTRTGNLTLYPLVFKFLFSRFKFQICLPLSFATKLLILHIQCLFRVGGSILGGVFLTSLFESSYSSDAVRKQQSIGSLELKLLQCSLQHQVNSGFRNWWLFSSIHSSLCCGVKPITCTCRLQLLTVKLLL